MSPFWIILGIIAVLILAWNFIPAFRTRMRGYTTALEGSIFATIPFIGDAIDALSETEWKSFVPEWAWKYCFAAGAFWFVWKRYDTKTRVGEQE
jgi:hypothetical protein